MINYTLKIFDIHGRMIKEVAFSGSSTSTNISNLSEGVYTYRILNKQGLRYTGSFVKQ